MQFKGGVGKTTLGVNLVGIASERGLNVVLVDMDKNAPIAIAMEAHEKDKTVRHALERVSVGDQVDDLLVKAPKIGENVYVLGASVNPIPDGSPYTSDSGEDLVQFIPDLIQELKETLVDGVPFDLVVFDLPGGNEPIIVNALDEIDSVLVPMKISRFDEVATERTYFFIKEAQKVRNGDPVLLGVILNDVEQNARMRDVVSSEESIIDELIKIGALLPHMPHYSAMSSTGGKSNKKEYLVVPKVSPKSRANKRLNLIWDAISSETPDRNLYKKDLFEYLKVEEKN